MTLILSNTDAILVAVPMLAMLFAGFFRLDELFSKPKKSKKRVLIGRPMVELDEKGRPICLDPYEGTKNQISQETVSRRRVIR